MAAARALAALGLAGALFLEPLSGQGAPGRERAPDFRVVSGRGRAMDRSTIMGRPTLLFHETQERQFDNLPFKESLKEAGLLDSGGLLVLAVADCSAFPRFIRPVIELAMQAKSREYGLEIYGDWDGAMAMDFRLERGASNIVLIDREGGILFRRAGALTATDRALLLEAVKALLQPGKP